MKFKRLRSTVKLFFLRDIVDEVQKILLKINLEKKTNLLNLEK